MIRRTPIKRSGSPIKRSGRPRKSNPKRIAKRKAAYRKMLSGKEYKAARAEAMERAGNQCEFGGAVMRLYPSIKRIPLWRCEEVENLHAHHLRYPKTRPVEARDLKIVCRVHHEYLESQKMHKTRMF